MVSVIIPVYKNTTEFINNLKKNLPYLKDSQIIVVNDDPTFSLKQLLKPFTQITLIENQKNLGFGQTINQGVKKAKQDYLMLLNSDVQLINNNWQLAINSFKKDPFLFAVCFAQKEKDGSIVGKNKIFWEQGLYHHQKANNLKWGENGWAEGGAAVFDKKKFLELGGFDPIYCPFYWEDIDLSVKAKKAGYRIIFDPRIIVIHHHQSTIGKYFNKNQIKTIVYRNQLIFTWKNLDSFQKISQHLISIPFLIIRHLLKGDFIFLSAFIKALFRVLTFRK